MWSAAVDPRVLAVRAGNPGGLARLFDAATSDARVVRGRHAEHLLIDRANDVFRLDVIEGTVASGPVSLRFDLADDDRLSTQISAINRFRDSKVPPRQHLQLAQQLLALQAVDAREAGASLREVSDIVLGPGAWPGDGEHRKSLVRRMIVAGDRMIRAGPAGALLDRPRGAWQLHPL
jgi:hypothetical protein